jgi:hypothetical protein
MRRDADVALPPHELADRLWVGCLAARHAFLGLLPHVVHHVGPLASALLAGVTRRRSRFSAFMVGPAISGDDGAPARARHRAARRP